MEQGRVYVIRNCLPQRVNEEEDASRSCQSDEDAVDKSGSFITLTASASIFLLVDALGKAIPYDVHSSLFHPALNPNSRRPSLIASRVDAIFATREGWR